MGRCILKSCGNIIIGQTSGELARNVSECLGKTLQDRERISINASDTSLSRSWQLETAVPVSTLSSLSSGEFVGMVADTPDQPAQLKTFHAKICLDEKKLRDEKNSYLPMPEIRTATRKDIQDNYLIIQQDIQDITNTLLEQILNEPGKQNLLMKK